MRIVSENIIFLSAFLLSILLSNISIAQEVEINLGKNAIALNEYYTITLKVKNGELKNYSGFPELHGFVKRGTSSQSSTSIINGRFSKEFSLVQNYQARAEGIYAIKPFTIMVNGVDVPNSGGKVKVGPEIKQQQHNHRDPFADFFGRNSEPQEYIDVKDDAFFSVSTNKDEIYVGEGFSMNIAFYVSENNRASMNWYDLSNQINDVIQKVKPKNCWEENFEVKEIKPEVVVINGTRYTKHLLYQAVFYPLNFENIVIPSVPFKMIKYKVAKHQSFFGNNHKQDIKTFYSKARKIKVKDLPEHPLKEQVAVGSYRLMEGVSKDEYKTGESFNYQFSIMGEGNISAIKEPVVIKDDKLQFYPPNEMQDINRNNGRVMGKKVFDYYIIPDEPGEYSLKKYLQWIYFNLNTEKYDTLYSDAVFNVTGDSKKNSTIRSSDLGSFYNRLPFEDTTLRNRESKIDYYLWLELLIVIILASVLYIYIKK